MALTRKRYLQRTIERFATQRFECQPFGKIFTNLLYFPSTYALLTKREVKMAGYWPSLFLRFYGPRRSRGP